MKLITLQSGATPIVVNPDQVTWLEVGGRSGTAVHFSSGQQVFVQKQVSQVALELAA
jgi:hypothetical protein